MPPAPRAARGRRDPSLLVNDPDVEAAHATDALLEQHQAGSESETPASPLLYAGDMVTANVTLAVDFGDGRTNFVGYRATTRVQDEEDHPDVYARLVTVVNQGVLGACEDIEASLAEYYAEREARQKMLDRVTGG